MSKYYMDEDCRRPLKQFCDSLGLPYRDILLNIYKLEVKPENKILKSHELANKSVLEYIESIEQEDNFGVLHDYIVEMSKKSNVDSDVVIKYMNKNKESSSLSFGALLGEAINYASSHKYFLNGVAVDDICDENGYNKDEVNKNIDMEIESNPTAPKAYSITKCLALAKIEGQLEFVIDGVPLIDKCRELDIEHMPIIIEYKKEYGDKPPLNEEGLKSIYNRFRRKPPRNRRNTVYGVPVSYYCTENGLSYSSVMNYKYGIDLQDKVTPEEDKYLQAIERYKYIKENKVDRKPDVFMGLKYLADLDCENYAGYVHYYCKMLNIDYERLMELNALGFSMYQAFYIIWFFSDLKDDKTKLLSISDKMLYSKVWAYSQGINANKRYMKEESEEESKEDLEDNQKYLGESINVVEKPKKKKEKKEVECEPLPLYNIRISIAYRFYKCELIDKDMLSSIIAYKRNYIDDIIAEVCAERNYDPDNDTIDFLMNAGFYHVMDAIEYCFYRDEENIKKYIKNYVKNGIINEIDRYEDLKIKDLTYRPNN